MKVLATILFAFMACIASSEIHQRGAKNLGGEEGKGRTAGTLATRYATCAVELSCSFPYLTKRNFKVEGSNEPRTEVAKKTCKLAPRTLKATAFDFEGSSKTDMEEAAKERLKRALIRATSDKGVPFTTNTPSWMSSTTQIQCEPVGGAETPKISCTSHETRSRIEVANQFFDHQASSSLLDEAKEKCHEEPFEKAISSVFVPRENDKSSLEAALYQLDPVMKADESLMEEGLSIKFPPPSTMWCYFVVEPTRQFIEGKAEHTSNTSTRGVGHTFQKRGWFSTRTFFSQAFFTQLNSRSSLSINTFYEMSGKPIILEQSINQGNDAAEMKQDACNQAQERYLQAHTVNDVLSGCFCSSSRLVPQDEKIAQYKIFEY